MRGGLPQRGGFDRQLSRLQTLLFPLLGELLEDHVPLQAREMVDEQHAVEMVHLVLEAGGAHAVDLFLADLAVEIEPAGADAVRAVHFRILIRHRQAAFGVRHVVIGLLEYFRVDEDARVLDRLAALFLRLLKVDHQDALRNADLDRGQADARRRVHRLEHVGDERAHFVVHRLYRLGDLTQARVGNFDDRTNGHERNLVFRVSRFKKSAGARARLGPTFPRQDSRARLRPEARAPTGSGGWETLRAAPRHNGRWSGPRESRSWRAR